MSLKSVAESFVGFLTHYQGELSGIATSLGDIVQHLPIDADDKARILGTVSELQEGAVNVLAAANALAGRDDLEVVVKASDVEAAVGAYLAAHPELFTPPGTGA